MSQSNGVSLKSNFTWAKGVYLYTKPIKNELNGLGRYTLPLNVIWWHYFYRSVSVLVLFNCSDTC